MTPTDYAAEQPTLDLKTYFNGTVDAWGMFQDRSGKVIKRGTPEPVLRQRLTGNPNSVMRKYFSVDAADKG